MKIKYVWSGTLLWEDTNSAGLALTDDGYWQCIYGAWNPITQSGSSGITGAYSKTQLFDADATWREAFRKINDGLKPDWCACSCGTEAVMGRDWSVHNSKCNSITLSSPYVPENNDNRASCYMCCYPNRLAGGGQYRVCQNQKCEWFNK